MAKPAQDIQALFKAKLKSSDLTPEDAKRLGYVIVAAPPQLADHFFNAPAFKLPYHDASGKDTGFYRIRYLAPTRTGLALSTKAKDRRYDQPQSELPQLYIPRMAGDRWTKVFADPAIPLIFTEGELKAACACKHGVPTLALGGVWNFKSKRNGLLRLPFFDLINFKGRTVFIVFDSDAATNPQVIFAQYKFAEEVFATGGTPIIINIPKVEGEKHGIDDYIVQYGAKAFKELITCTDNHVEFAFVRELMRLNTEIAVVHKPVAIMHFPTGQLLDRGDAATLYANARMLEKKIVPAKNEDDAETVKHVEVATFDSWLKWEQRGEVYSPVYEPGQPQFVLQEDGGRMFNTWRGWGAVPERGDVSLWKWLLDQIFKNAEPAHRKWFEQWCAYPLQNPGVKMFTCPILFGQLKGTGKSLLGLSLMSIYGDNGAEITDAQLEDDRNVFMVNKQFVLANEVTGSDKRRMVGRLRNLITQHTVHINVKFVPDYYIRDVINYLLTSNMLDAVYMEDDERRFFVHEVLGPRLVDVDANKVRAYDVWLRSGECAKALFHYLLNVDLEGFDPTAPAPDTKSKSTMVEASRTELEVWCAKLAEDPDTCLRTGSTIIPHALFTLKQLIDIYAGGDGKKPYEKSMGNALRKAGFVKVANANSCPTKDGKINLWLVRRMQELSKLSPKDAGALYDSERALKEAKKFAKGGGRDKK